MAKSQVSLGPLGEVTRLDDLRISVALAVPPREILECLVGHIPPFPIDRPGSRANPSDPLLSGLRRVGSRRRTSLPSGRRRGSLTRLPGEGGGVANSRQTAGERDSLPRVRSAGLAI